MAGKSQGGPVDPTPTYRTVGEKGPELIVPIRRRVQVREPLTYQEGAPRSFYLDILKSTRFNDDDATERLAQHQREMDVETRGTDLADPATESREGYPIEYRVNPNSTLGTGGEFTVPLYLVDKFATAGRAGRPFGDLLQPMVLPNGVSSIHTPRITPGDLALPQTDAGAAPGADFGTADAASNVVTIAGESDIAQQLFDLSPIAMDAAIYLDLNRAYNKALESELLYGSTGFTTQQTGHLLGIANISGINTVVGTGGTTIQTLWPLLGQTAAAIGNLRLLPPEAWLWAPRRWFWVASSVDNSQRPVGSPGNTGPHATDYAAAGGSVPFGPVLGLPVYLDGGIPAGSTADDAFAVRPSDMFLWESAPRTITAVNPLSGALQLRLSLHRYVAFIGNRYPNGIGRLTALPQPSNF